MKFFFSCDWGTSAFRLRLVDAGNAGVLAAIKTGHGIAAAFEGWKQTNGQETGRPAFYQAYLFEQVKNIARSFGEPLDDVPLVLSGMASSSIGMVELPYKEIPFRSDGANLVVHTIAESASHPNKMIIISGARSEADVLRGEETMLAGCSIDKNDTGQLFIFPGTHSKHITVKAGMVENFTTFMTGELFDLLANKSILSASVKKTDRQQDHEGPFFIEGVKEAARSNLANSIFHVRTNQLFKKATHGENYGYLSGLLIGNELKDVVAHKDVPIILVCNDGLKDAYIQAFAALGWSGPLYYQNADDALIMGQLRIMRQFGHL